MKVTEGQEQGLIVNGEENKDQLRRLQPVTQRLTGKSFE